MGKLFSIRIIEFIVNIYDFITWPIYYIIQRPWQARQKASRVRARQVDEFTWQNVNSKLDKSNRRSVETLDQLFRDSVSNYADHRCLGVRKVLAVEYKESPSNNAVDENHRDKLVNEKNQQVAPVKKKRVISKYVLADKYTWYSYKQIEDIVINLSAGLVHTCNESIVNPDGTRKLLICADTCMQWFLIAHACFRNNVTVVTAYTTLDDDAILHSIQQTEVRILVISQKFASRLPKILAQSSLVDTIVVLDDPLPGEEDERVNLKSTLSHTSVKRVISYDEMVEIGKKNKEVSTTVPSGSDIAVLMYTSGSTGKAKGVMLSHRSIVYTALSFSGPGNLTHEDRYIGYLPLGHVLELAAECIFLRNGSTIAYSSPNTLTSSSPYIKKGQSGDAYIFKPTIMGAVPLVLDRLKSGIQQAVKSQGLFYDQLINDFVVRYKRYWWERYYDTPILNYLICRKFNMILGGEMRAVCSGGAALSRETQEYLRHVGNYVVLQGYGLTETSAAASFCDVEDRRYNVVGPPYPVVRIKLESWSDYSVHDKPFPRGEIVIGGQPVSSGYYKMEELTKESFYVDPKTGMRYFRTGDIGLMLPDGVLKIIDRKKDIVKPLSGEYISLSEIETIIRTVPLVENIFVYCSQYSNYVVAIIKTYAKELKALAKDFVGEESELSEKFRNSISRDPSNDTEQIGSIIDSIDLSTLSANKFLVGRVLKLIQHQAALKNLKRTHIPSRIMLVTEDWSPESGLATASFKLRRRELERYYANAIKQLYAEMGQKIDQEVN